MAALEKFGLAPWHGLGDFGAQPVKIRPFTTSTGFLRILTGCKLVAINLNWSISYIHIYIYIYNFYFYFFQVPANFFFIIMTTG
jgi:hypothetical protein